MYLVYEKNYAIDDVDCIEECEMKLYSSLEAAKREMSRRKESYEREILYTFLPSKSSEKYLFFAVKKKTHMMEHFVFACVKFQ